jgi:hypothetical protein
VLALQYFVIFLLRILPLNFAVTLPSVSYGLIHLLYLFCRLLPHSHASIFADVVATAPSKSSFLFVCGVLKSGGVFCGGNNDFGQLGTGDWMTRTSPDAVVGLPAGAAQWINLVQTSEHRIMVDMLNITRHQTRSIWAIVCF